MDVRSEPKRWSAEVRCSARKSCGFGATVYAEDLEVMEPRNGPDVVGVRCPGCGRFLAVNARHDARELAVGKLREPVEEARPEDLL
jgi:hypothetical protein